MIGTTCAQCNDIFKIKIPKLLVLIGGGGGGGGWGWCWNDGVHAPNDKVCTCKHAGLLLVVVVVVGATPECSLPLIGMHVHIGRLYVCLGLTRKAQPDTSSRC